MLVNNAGVMLLGPFGSEQRDEARRMVEVNLLGAMTATEVFLPTQLRDGGGDLVNISSVAGRTARAGNAAYAATKWGMNGWSEALRQELQPDIRVTVIEPGAVATELTDHITDPDMKAEHRAVLRPAGHHRRRRRRRHRVRRHPATPDDPQRDPAPPDRAARLILNLSTSPPTTQPPAAQRLLVPSSALLWGLQMAFLSPALALILVNLYGASTTEVGWVLGIYNASGFIASLVVPAYADRKRDYLGPMLACGVLTLALAGVLAAVTTLPLATIALVVIGGPAGVGSSLLFAHLRHSGARPADIVNTRAIVSVAWVAGPPLATLIIGLLGERAILLALAAVAILTSSPPAS